jgi:dTDP-4-dehydrorhamnose 3,5-epimerase
MNQLDIRQLAGLHGYKQQHEKPIRFNAPHRSQEGPTSRDSLRWHLDARGGLAELYRQSWHGPAMDWEGIRQAYISTTQPDVVKGWHLHGKQTDRFVCLRGRILLATYDLNGCAPAVTTQVLEPSRSLACVSIPPGVAHGWLALGDAEAWVLNLCSQEYDGTDEWRRNPNDGPVAEIPFNWRERRDG